MRSAARFLVALLLLAALSGCESLHGFAQKNSGSPARFGTSVSLPLGEGAR